MCAIAGNLTNFFDVVPSMKWAKDALESQNIICKFTF